MKETIRQIYDVNPVLDLLTYRFPSPGDVPSRHPFFVSLHSNKLGLSKTPSSSFAAIDHVGLSRAILTCVCYLKQLQLAARMLRGYIFCGPLSQSTR